MDLKTLGLSICGDEVPKVLGLFDFSVAPPLLFYSYIPILLLSTLIAFFIYFKDKKSLQGRLLLLMIVFFDLWVLDILALWVASHHSALMFGWQLTALFEVGLFLSAFYFAYVFLFKKDLSLIGKLVLFFSSFLTIVLTPTVLNISSYDIASCEGVVGPLWSVIYALEPVIIVSIILLGIRAYRTQKNSLLRKQDILFTVGLSLFLSVFFLFNFYGELTGVYEFNLWGPLGMLVFLTLLGYLVVQFKAFNIGVIAAQALSVALVFLIGSQFFFVQSNTNKILIALTLAVTGGISILLIRSVEREIRQKEEIQKLAENLKQANEMKARFLSIASHQFRSPLTAIKGYASLLLDGSYGDVPEKAEEPVERILTASNNLALVVDDFLNLSRIEQGRMEYKFEEIDLREFLQSVVDEQEAVVRKKEKLSLTFYVQGDGPFDASIDRGKLKQVATNLVDNSIKYTPEGSISVYLERDDKDSVFRFWVKDTGVGIPTDVLPKLFGQFTRAANADQVNVMGTGLGLYIAREIVKAHGGKVWAESEGEGKGAKFTVEIPIKRG